MCETWVQHVHAANVETTDETKDAESQTLERQLAQTQEELQSWVKME